MKGIQHVGRLQSVITKSNGFYTRYLCDGAHLRAVFSFKVSDLCTLFLTVKFHAFICRVAKNFKRNSEDLNKLKHIEFVSTFNIATTKHGKHNECDQKHFISFHHIGLKDLAKLQFKPTQTQWRCTSILILGIN